MAWTPEPTPSKLALLVRALVDLPLTWARTLPKIGRGVANLSEMKKRYEESGQELPPTVADARDSPLNMMLGKRRTFVFETFELQEIRSLSKGFGVTINDLFVAAAASAYRPFMIAQGFDPDAGPLVTAIPVSKRPSPEQDDFIGNIINGLC